MSNKNEPPRPDALCSDHLRVVGPGFTPPKSETRSAEFEHARQLDFVDITASPGSSASSYLASPAQLASLMTHLGPSEELVAHIDLATRGRSGLSVEMIAKASSRREATDRCATLTRALDAALRIGLPHFDIAAVENPARRMRYKFKRTLAPAGATLPIGISTEPPRPQSRAVAVNQAVPSDGRADGAPACDVVVFSPNAAGTHLAGLAAAIHSVATDIAIEVRMSRAPFDSTVLKQMTDIRGLIAGRLHSDNNRYLRDPRYAEADKHFEDMIVEGAGIRLEVIVRSKRALVDVEASALSAALFGKPDKRDQPGHLANFRNLYPHHDAVLSFLGILAAAIGPALERRDIDKLEGLEGNIIGKVKSGRLVRMAVAAPRSHTYVIGRPGSGKSTLLHNLIQQDIENGDTVVLIDPHGDLWGNIRDTVPASRKKDLMLIHMGDPALQPKLNLLDIGPGNPAEARTRLVDTMCQIVKRLMFSGLTVDATGPMFNKYFRAALMLLLEAEGPNARIDQIETVFADEDYRNELRHRPSVSEQTKEQMNQILNVSYSDHTIESMTPWVTSKMSMLTQSAILKPIINATETSFTFDQVLAENKICLINLANGRIGSEPATLLGGILTHRLEQAAKRQEALEFEDRKKASVYFDEFHTFASEFLRPLMAESRKYGLRVTLANQTLSQMKTNDIQGGVLREVLGNCANTLAFAIDIDDAVHLAPRFSGRINPIELVAQPNFQAICQFQTQAAALGPFIVKTMPAPASAE